MSDLELRPIADDDYDDLVNLLACCFGEESECVLDVDRDYPYLKKINTYYKAGGGGGLVAENHLGIVGLISWLPFHIDKNQADFGLSGGMLIDKLYVHPLIRRQRLGMELMFAAIDVAESVNAPSIDLWMNIKYHRGHKFLRFFTFETTTQTRASTDLQKSIHRRYYLDVDDFLDALDNDPQFYDDFFAPPDQPDTATNHEDIDDPSQFVVDQSEAWR